MVEVVQVSNEENLNTCFRIRKEVFVKEQHVPENEEYEFEDESVHFLATFQGQPAGTARYRKTPNGVKLERFAVLPEFRKFGVGAALLSRLLKEVNLLFPDTLIYLHAQVQAEPFYEKQGFLAQGDLFFECEIPHHKMVFSQA